MCLLELYEAGHQDDPLLNNGWLLGGWLQAEDGLLFVGLHDLQMIFGGDILLMRCPW